MLNILLSSAGRRVELLGCLRSDLHELGIEGRVIATDASPLTSAGLLADTLVLMPRADAPNYIEVLSDVIEEHRIGLVVPTIDTELAVLAEATDHLGELGVRVLAPGSVTVGISGDKESTHRFLAEAGLPRPQQWSADEALEQAAALPYPVISKPRQGSSSVGVFIVTEPAGLGLALSDRDHVVQTLANGKEYTVDVWVDQRGQVRSAVPRRRIEVRAGEVSKGVTENNAMVIDLARSVADELPDAYGPLTIQIFADGEQAQVIEMNSRFGGGYPLSWKAGAPTTRWAMQDAIGTPYHPSSFAWQDGLVMLRYDKSVYIHETDVPR